ncbi:fatty acid elongation protein, GNS1/SUR4 family, putative [Hepatocystis sp. ex Piliocolobus tephrosceles]|nr:fatty acid elongation protein, GNS1/SUR4 family, putative [Hepatocystis sp. ex Piliocolobus tephrosceles]
MDVGTYYIIRCVSYFFWHKEKNFKPFWFISFIHNKYILCPIVVIMYILFCKYGNNILMKNRKALNIKFILLVWNFLLSIFNFIVFIKLLPVFSYIIYNYTLNGLLIIPPIYLYGYGAVGLWICLFILSKYLELADTLFLVLRNKKINLLHWFHHSTVLLYTWDTYYMEMPAGFTFILINAFVHTIMYGYYFFSTLFSKPLRCNVYVTILQITQMLIGIFITMYCLFITIKYDYSSSWELSQVNKLKQNFSFKYGHYVSKKNAIYAILMYVAYLCLFAKYFIQRYMNNNIEEKKK